MNIETRVNYLSSCKSNVLKPGPVSDPEKGPGRRVTGSTAVEPELNRYVLYMYIMCNK